MILAICDNPEIMSIMLIINKIILIVKIVVPILLIIIVMIDLTKAVMANNEENIKKIVHTIPNKAIAVVLIFLIPSLVTLIVDLVGTENNYSVCLVNASEEGVNSAYLARASLLVSKAESSTSYNDYYAAVMAVADVKDESAKANYTSRLEVTYATIEERIKAAEEAEKKKPGSSGSGDVGGSGSLDNSGGSYSSGSGKCQMGVEQSTEPDPSNVVSCWPNLLTPSKFTYPKDSSGKSLGAWPSNYSSIPTQLTGYKTYGAGGAFIFSTTPVNGNYQFGYDHNGIDIAAYFGTPVYSPVDGTLIYSEWGHTSNKQGDESSYSVSILMNKAVTVSGVSIKQVFLTHLSGIRYRCSSGNCNKTVKKGELVGFTGNASGRQVWAPHLHMTLHPESNYSGGLQTPKIEALYGIPTHSSSYAIKAGG